MELKFTIAEPGTMAFSEQYYGDSASHRRIRNRTRWALPVLLLPILVVFTYQFGFSWTTAAIFVAAAVAWIVIAPKRFDTRVKNYMQRQMFESSYSKVFGVYKVKIEEKHLVCDGPTGYTEYRWDAVDRVTITDDFLFIFLAGPSGFPIRIAEIGKSIATEAYGKIQSLIVRAK
jgi:hypothetical protein